jgi:hypothetical protein
MRAGSVKRAPAGARGVQAYLSGKPMTKPNHIWALIGKAALIAALFAMLGASAWYAAGAWTRVDGPPMPAAGYAAMALGVVFSLIVGCGLMALVFYSSRHGYDEPFRHDDSGE